MFDHISLRVSDLQKSRAFYTKALAPLGYAPLVDVTREQTGDYEGTGYGKDGRATFWIGDGKARSGPTHVAFTAASRADVDRFYKAAMAAGGSDNGAPGPRPHYHANYYGAFVLDPDGNNIEAVCRAAH